MFELIQFPWSPFCVVQRRILEYAGVRHRLVNISSVDRTLVWRWTRQRYYQVPILKDGKAVIFETGDDSQVIAKYLDAKLQLGLFPRTWEGVQTLLWRAIENEIEGVGFKLNDIYWEEFVPPRDRLSFLRHKERKFGRGCLEQWRRQQDLLLGELAQRLMPYERMLEDKPFLLDSRPRFVDFDLYGMLANFLYAGHFVLPPAHTNLRTWLQKMGQITVQPDPAKRLGAGPRGA
jgi:glutathione S-transferase